VDPVLYILSPIILLAYTTEVLTGFGATLVAVTLGAHFYPVDRWVPVLVSLNIFVTGYVAFRYRTETAKALLLKSILPCMVTGLLLGLALFPLIKGIALKRLLGLMVTVFAARELFLLMRPARSGRRPLPAFQASLWQILAGVAHAFYATGGPPLVYAVSRLNLPRTVFRATMCTVWASMNTFLIVVFSLNGRINAETLSLTAWLIPVLPLGILLGEWLHKRINEHLFRVFIYSLLLISGLTLVR
jgi:uncharacterized membrane protein YfcA